MGQPGHHGRSDGLSDDSCALDVGGVDRAGGNVAGVVGVAITQPSFKSYCAHPAESLRRLVSGEQDQCGLAVREIERPFQGWEILQ